MVIFIDYCIAPVPETIIVVLACDDCRVIVAPALLPLIVSKVTRAGVAVTFVGRSSMPSVVVVAPSTLMVV